MLVDRRTSRHCALCEKAASCSARHRGLPLRNWNRSLTEEPLLPPPFAGVSETGGIRDKLGDIYRSISCSHTEYITSAGVDAQLTRTYSRLLQPECLQSWEDHKVMVMTETGAGHDLPLFATKIPLKEKKKAKHNSTWWIFLFSFSTYPAVFVSEHSHLFIIFF